MSKQAKRPSRRERFEAKAWGLHPRSGQDMLFRGLNGDGGFAFRSPAMVWYWLTAFPAAMFACFTAASAIGFLVWAPALFLAALFGFLGMASMTIAYRAFLTRGWGAAIMDIEHRKRKDAAYKESA